MKKLTTILAAVIDDAEFPQTAKAQNVRQPHPKYFSLSVCSGDILSNSPPLSGALDYYAVGCA